MNALPLCRWCRSPAVTVIVHVEDESGRELRIEHECTACRQMIDQVGTTEERARQMRMAKLLEKRP